MVGFRALIIRQQNIGLTEVFSNMIEKTGAETFRCQLVAIKDYPHEKDVTHWIIRFINENFNDLILFNV